MFTSNVFAPIVLAALALAQDYPYPGGTGFISPAKDASISKSEPLNITFNPARYARESTGTTTFYLLSGSYSDVPEAATYLNILGALADVKSNTQLGTGYTTAVTDAISTTLDIKAPAGAAIIVGIESWTNPSGSATAYWTQSFTLTD